MSGESARRALTRRRCLAALLGGAVLIEAVVRAEIGSGLFSSAALDDDTRGRVLRLLIGGKRP